MPIPAAVIEYVPAPAPIRDAVTKFGGQPVWLEAPMWPVSRSLRKPMHFICQIKLDDVPGLRTQLKGPARMAYVFISDDASIPPTWEPDGGEHAIILQPGGELPSVATTKAATGPSSGGPQLREWTVRLTPQEEPEARGKEGQLGAPFYSSPDFIQFPNDEWHRLIRDKLGGLPMLDYWVSYPSDGPWLHFLQFRDSGPFNVNFACDGCGHAFISPDGRRGRFLWHR